MGYSFRLAARVLLYAPSHRQDSTYHGLCYTKCGSRAGAKNSSMGPPHKGSIRRPIAPWANALTTELHLAPWELRWWRLETKIPISLALCFISSTFKWDLGARCSSMVMVRWFVGSIPLSYFSFQPVFHDWFNKGHGMYYPVCGMVHIKEPLLLIGRSIPCGGSGFPLSQSQWFFTICPTPHNRK